MIDGRIKWPKPDFMGRRKARIGDTEFVIVSASQSRFKLYVYHKGARIYGRPGAHWTSLKECARVAELYLADHETD